MSVDQQLGGALTQTWNPDGLLVEVVLPPDALSRG